MKNFNLFEKLWEQSRTLRRVGLVLVMCLISITQAWAAYDDTKSIYLDISNAHWYTDAGCVPRIWVAKKSDKSDNYVHDYDEQVSTYVYRFEVDKNAVCIQFYRYNPSTKAEYNWSGELWIDKDNYEGDNACCYKYYNYYVKDGDGNGFSLSNRKTLNSSGGEAYFYAGNLTTTTYVSLLIGRWDNSKAETMSLVNNTEKLYYTNQLAYNIHAWTGVVGTTSEWTNANEGANRMTYASDYASQKYGYKFNDGSKYYLTKESTTKGSQLNIDYKANYSDIPTYTTTLNVKVKEGGAGSYSNGSISNKPATTVSLQGTILSSGGTSGSSRSSVNWTAGSGCSYNSVISGAVTTSYSSLGSTWNFDGWYINDERVGTGTSYDFYQHSNTTVEARFTKKYTITYYKGTGDVSGSAPSATMHLSGETATVKDNTGLLKKDGKVFAGWATSQSRADAGTIDYDPCGASKTFTISSNVTLYPVWKNGSYFISLTGASTNGVKNTTDFVSTQSLQNNATTVNGVTFSKSYYKTSGSINSSNKIKGQNENTKYIIYDAKTTVSKVRVYMKHNGGSTSTANIYYYVAKEGVSPGDNQTFALTNGSEKVLDVDLISTKGARFIIGTDQYERANFTQIIAFEEGTPLPSVGETGYQVSFPGRTSTVKETDYSFNGLTINGNDALKIDDGNELRLVSGGSRYVSFTTTDATQLQVTIGGTTEGFVVCTNKSNAASTGSGFGGTKNTTYSINLSSAGTYYILGNTGSNEKITKIAFADYEACAAPTGLAASDITSSGATLTVTDGSTRNYEFYVSTSGTAPTASTEATCSVEGSKTKVIADLSGNTTYHAWVRAFESRFNKSDWVALTGSTFKTNVAVPTHTLTWNLGGGTATGGTAAGSVAEGAALTAPTVTKEGYDFASWSPTVPATMPSSDATYTAQWTKVYASGTYTFENAAALGTAPNKLTMKDKEAVSVAAGSRIDNMFFSAMSITYESGTYGGEGDDFKGWKIKTSGATIKFFVENDCNVTFGVGNLTSGAKVTYTNQSDILTENQALNAKEDNTYAVKGGTMVTFKTDGGSTVTLKKIAIEDPCTKPTAPTGLGVDSKTHNSANLSWDGKSAGANGYKIALVANDGGSGAFDWKDEATAMYTASGLSANKSYTFKVKYKGTDGQCDFSDEVTTTFTTNKTPLSLSLSYTSTSLTVGGGNSATPTLTGNTGVGAVTYTVTDASPSGCVTVDSYGVVTPVHAGTATITASVAAAGDYAAGSATADFTIGKGSISPTLNYSSTTISVGDVTSTPTVDGNTGSGTVSYEVTSASPAGCITINTSTGVVTAVAVGTATVTATIAATSDYNGNTATADFTISACTPTNASVVFDNNKSAKYNTAWAGSDVATSGGASWVQSEVGTDSHKNSKMAMKLDGDDDYIKITLPVGVTSGSIIVKACTWDGGSGTLIINSSNSKSTPLSSTEVGLEGKDATYKINGADAETWTAPTLKTVAYDGISAGGDYYIMRGSSKSIYVFSVTATGTKPCAATTYTVTYADGGATSGSVPTDTNSPYEEGATVTVLGNTGSLEKDGYTFGGWSADVDLVIDEAPATAGTTIAVGKTFSMPAEDVTLTAVWTPNDYTITYHLNGASWAGGYSAPTEYTVGTGAPLPLAGNMTNTGYSFNGWKNNSGLTGDNITAIGTSDYGNKEFWAKWTENTYTITYKKNGDGAGNDGDVTGSTSSTNGHYVTVADNGFALEDHVFAGWNTAANGSGESYSEGEEIELTDDMTLYAIWTDDYNVTWGDVQIGGAGDAVTPNLGGKNYTITATIATWTGDVTDIELGDVTSGVTASITGTTSSPSKTVTITFAVGTSVEGSSINLSLNVPAHGDYGAKVATTDAIEIEICSGGTIVWDFTTTDFKNGGTWSTSGGAENKAYATDEETILRYYAGGSSDEWDSSNKQLKTQGTTSFSTGTSKKQMNQKYFQFPTLSGSATISVTYGTTGDDLKIYEATSTDIYGIDPIITLTTSSTTSSSYTFSSAKTYYMTMESNKSYFKNITVTYAGGGSSVTPTLTWSPAVSGDAAWDDDNDRLNKRTSDADFTFTATQNKNSLGAITYASSNTSVVTVNATTGKVHVEGAGDATITATLAESGCYNKATAIYAIHVVDDCDDEAGTISTEDLGCDGIRMTVTGHTAAEGVSYQWYKVKAEGSDDEVGENQDNYTATTAGEYYVIVTNTGDRHCAKTSTNTVVIAAKAAVTATKIVDSWYVKNGRRTPDVALVQSENAESFTVKSGSTTIWESAGSTKTGFGGCGFHMDENGIIYLNGTTAADGSGNAPSGLTAGDETLTITVSGCGGDPVELGITIHKQASTTLNSVAFVVDGTKGGAFDADNEIHSVNTALYKYLDNTASGGTGAFDLTAQNIYATTDEKAIREHYSQFDAILITDDPGTKETPSGDYKTKGYVNAFGTMVDVRPILTMEAYVSALANWKTKGIAGEPTSPNPRQYALRLECKDHEIYKEGLPDAAPGTNVWDEVIGGETYRNVVLVDHTKSPYTGLADDEQTAGKESPALQGFDGTASGSLLGLGRISNGSLQAAIERQEEPAARLLVFSIQAKALPNALTNEGKRIIQNILTYLLKTNMEEVDDCSNYFTGKTNSDWNTPSNWSKTELPSSEAKVRILAPCVIGEGTTARVAQVEIVSSGKSSIRNTKTGSADCDGALTISAGGSLIVGGKIRKAEAPHFGADELMPMDDPSKLIINTGSTAQAALIFNNDEGETQATVNLYSLGRKIDSKYQFQYFAVPMEYVAVNPSFAGTGIYTYVWHENGGWERRGYYTDLYAFEGVGITTASSSPRVYTMTGNLASTATQEITLTKDADGENIIGNSWTAPINIASLVDAFAEDGNVDKVVYIYITGNDNMEGDHSSTEVAGKWLAIPIDASGWSGWTGQKVIPAMQAFYIKATSETTLTMDYNSLVRTTPEEQLNKPLKAPLRAPVSGDAISMLKLRVEDSSTYTDLYLFEGNRFSDSYDNGWEAKQMGGDGYMQLYAQNMADKMAVLATDELDGTVIGFEPGKETEYTISFSGASNGYYLNDVKTRTSTLIVDGGTYSFENEAGDDANRFFISRTPFETPGIATGVTDLDAEAPKVQKVIYNDKLYIIRGGKVFSADGQLVK